MALKKEKLNKNDKCQVLFRTKRFESQNKTSYFTLSADITIT